MKRSVLVIMALTLLTAGQAQDFRSQAPKPDKASKILLGDYQTFKLNNGLTVILVENHELPTVDFNLQLAMEPILEGKSTGTASFAGQLLRTGTTTRTKSQLDEEIDFLGASITTDPSGIYGSCLKKHQEKVLELMTDILYHPVFPQEEFEKLKKQTLSVLQMNSTDPNEIASVVARVLRYGKDHPYGEPTTEETVNNITLDGIREYYQTYFKPDIGYLIMIGDLKLDESKLLAGKYFDSWKPGKVGFSRFADPAPLAGNLVGLVDRPGAVQSVITITSTFTLKPGDPDVLPARLMNNVLGGGVFSGRLMMNLREDKAYTYGATSSLSYDQLIGNFTAGAQVRTSVTDSAINEFLYEMRRMQDGLISEEDLTMNKNVMAGEFARALENPSTLASFAMNTIRFNLPRDYYSTYLERLEKITREEVQQMARKYLSPGKCIILVVGNKQETGQKLARFSGTGAVSCYDRYGNPLSPVPMAVAEGITAKYVIDQYIQALGGRQALRGIRQITSRAAGKVEAMGQTAKFTLNSWQEAPDRLCQETRVGETLVRKQVYDGSAGWQINMGNFMDITGEDLRKMKEGARMFPEIYYVAPGYHLTLEGMEDLEGRIAYRIQVLPPGGTARTEFYEVSSGLKIRVITTTVVDGESMESQTDYSDYRDVGGVKFPFQMKHTLPGQSLLITLERMDTVTPVDPGIFKK